MARLLWLPLQGLGCLDRNSEGIFLETDVLNKTLYIDICISSCLQINIDMLTLMNGQSLSQSEFVGKIFGFLYWFSIILLWLFYSHFDSLRSFLTYLLTNSSSQSKNNISVPYTFQAHMIYSKRHLERILTSTGRTLYLFNCQGLEVWDFHILN